MKKVPLFIFLLFIILAAPAYSATGLSEQLSGNILLQVEQNGEAWYVNPEDGKRYYMENGVIAYEMMRQFGLGIRTEELKKIPIGIEERFALNDSDQDGLYNKLEQAIGTNPLDVDSDNDGFSDAEEVKNGYSPIGSAREIFDPNLANRLQGKILLQVESRGEAWYVNPSDGKRYYMPDGNSAYQIMRFLSLGITDGDIGTIEVGQIDLPTSSDPEPTPSPDPAPEPEPTPEPVVDPELEPTPKPLTQYPMSTVTFAGNQRDINMQVGETYKLSGEDYIRLEKIADGKARISVWNYGDKGCRLVDAIAYLDPQHEQQRYTQYLRWFIEVENVTADSVDLKLYTGDIAHQRCNQIHVQPDRCLAFHEVGTQRIGSENFTRHFTSPSYYDFNNLMLNYTEAAYAKLKSVFPSLASASPYGNYWNFISVVDENAIADSSRRDTAVIHVDASGASGQLLTDEDLRNVYQQKLHDGDLDFSFTTEMHEWVHMSLYLTELSGSANPSGSTSILAEGVAEYVESIAKNYPDKTDHKYATCGEDRFLGEGGVLSGLTYIEAFDQGYYYEPGYCFFEKVESACGISAIDSMFGELLTYQYEPFAYHSNLFKVLRDNCANPNEFDGIMSNFGFSNDLLNETYQVGSYVSIKEMACE